MYCEYKDWALKWKRYFLAIKFFLKINVKFFYVSRSPFIIAWRALSLITSVLPIDFNAWKFSFIFWENCKNTLNILHSYTGKIYQLAKFEIITFNIGIGVPQEHFNIGFMDAVL